MLMKPSKNRRAQSAMEYLMTYGWAILIIAVVLGALFSLGVFSGSSLLGNACIAASGYLCSNPVYLHGTPTAAGFQGNILVTVGQNTGTTWTSANVYFVPQGTSSVAGLPSTSPIGFNSAANPGFSNVILFGTGLVSGQQQSMYLPVSSTYPLAVGTAATGTIWAQYCTATLTAGNVCPTPQYVQLATINIKAS